MTELDQLKTIFNATISERKKYDAALEVAAAELKQVLLSTLINFFKDNPTYQSVYWTQGTPSFNDGDACYFGVNDLCAVTLVTNDDGEEEEEDDCVYHSGTILDDISNILSMHDDLMEVAFGDNMKIRLDRDATDFDVEDYYDY